MGSTPTSDNAEDLSSMTLAVEWEVKPELALIYYKTVRFSNVAAKGQFPLTKPNP